MDSIFRTCEIVKYDKKIKTSDFLNSISDKNSSQLRDFCFKIMEIEDPFHSLSLLLRIRTSEQFIDSLFMERLSSLIRKINGEKYLRIKNMDEKIYWFVMRHTKDSDVQAMIRCFSFIEINKTNLEELKRYFSYSTIYQHYRSICKNIFKEKYRRQEISLTIRLLDSASLCFKNLYPIIKKIAKCAKRKSIDKSVIECAKLLGCVVKYEQRALYNYQDYIISVLSFLCNILTETKNYVFLGLEDLNEITIAIARICEYKKNDLSLSKLFTGLYASSYDIIDKYNKIWAHLEEDLLCLTVNLQLTRILYRVTYHQGLRAFDYNQFYNDIINLKYGKPVNLSMKKYKRVLSTFYTNKYKLLDIVYDNQPFNTEMLVNDISGCSDCYGVLRSLKKLTLKLKLDQLIRVGIIGTEICKNAGYELRSSDLSATTNEQQNTKHVRNGSVKDEGKNKQEPVDNNVLLCNKEKDFNSHKMTNQKKNADVMDRNETKKNNKDLESMLNTETMNDGQIWNNSSLDEKNYVFLIKFALKRCFIDQKMFEKNVKLYKMFLVDKGQALILIATSTFTENMKDLKYTGAHLDLLSFILVLNINNRNNRIVCRKEQIIINVFCALKSDDKTAFVKYFFENLEKLKCYEFNPFFVSFILTFNKEIKRTENTFVKYVINALEWNENTKTRFLEMNKSRNDNNGIFTETYTKIYVSLVCYVCVKYKLKITDHMKSYYGVIIMLINCIELSTDNNYQNILKTNILEIVFDLSEEQRNDVKALYYILLKNKCKSGSVYLCFYKNFLKRINKKIKQNADKKNN